MSGRTSRWLLWLAPLLVLLGFLLPPLVNVNRYRNRVVEAIGRALGRDVSASNIELKLLPRPGLILSNVVVTEDPSYGVEPMLRAGTVTAYLRLTSLWRGRLEIGTLDLDAPSLNLVRRSDGHWNLEDLVQRASHVASAPTSQKRPEARPRFPYIEASSGRINFKLGEAKKAFAFTDADFALWLESENEWGIRLEAHPTRTDVGINNAGTLKINGRFQRADSLGRTPLNLKVTFEGGPLGQVTKLIYGRDRGWRGTVSSSATLAGTPESLTVTTDAEVDDFRRYDIALGEALGVGVHCTGTYSSLTDTLQDIQCESPAGSGVLRLRGNVHGWAADAYDLSLSGEQVPADKLAGFARHAKKDLPADLTATGEVEGAFTVRKLSGGAAIWAGGGRSQGFALRSAVLKQDLEIGEVLFVVPRSTASADLKRRHSAASKTDFPGMSPGFRLLIKPFPLLLGAASPATASAVFDKDHYDVSLSGPAELGRLLTVAKAVGVGTPGIGLAGAAQIEFNVAGTWVGFAPPVPSGKILVHGATAELQGVSEPLQIASAAVTLRNQILNVDSFTASFAKGPEVSGTAAFPVHCTDPGSCGVRFDLRSNDVSLARLNQLVNPSFFSRPWYHLLAIGQRHEDAFLKLRASGRVAASRFELGTAVATNATATVEFNAGQLRVSDLHADLLGGKHVGAWTADFAVSPPRFSGSGNIVHVSMAQLATLMHDNWAAGVVDGHYTLAMSGMTAVDLGRSASGSATFNWSGGSLRHVTLDGRGTPMAFSAFGGKITLQNGTFSFPDCKLQSGGNNYLVTGTASYDRNLDFRMEREGGRAYVISGTLGQPRVEPVPSATAQVTPP